MTLLNNFLSNRIDVDCLNALIVKITIAFGEVLREDGITLHEAVAIDDYKPYAEQQAARRLDTEQRWQDVPDEAIKSALQHYPFLMAKDFVIIFQRLWYTS